MSTEPLDLDAIEARERAATPGPWTTRTASTGIRGTTPYAFVEAGEGRRPIVERHNGGTLADVEFIAHARTDVPDLVAEVERLRERLAQSRDYHPSGHCRTCSGREGAHAEYCRLYVGPLTHEWARTRVNDTFGGIDYDCRCGGWFRQGGLAGHGDGTENATPVCPNADQAYRGEPS